MSANRKLLDRYVERYNAGDLDAVMDLYAEDAVQLMPDGTFEGRSTIRERLAQELNGFTDVAHRVESFVEQADAFADEWTFVGTHTGPMALPDGTRATSNRQAGGDQGDGARAAPRREDRRRQPVLRQHGRSCPARPRARGGNRLIELGMR